MGSVISFINQGGTVMYIILFVFAIGLSIIIERGIYLFKSKINAGDFMNEIIDHVKKGKISDAKMVCAQHDAPLPKIIAAGISNYSQNKEELREAVDEVAITEIPKLLKRTHYLPLIANISTLLGLLGTIFGLMQSFISVAGADPALKAALLAKGISIAMNTTALGLIVAIPCMMGHSFLTSTTQDIIHEIDQSTTRLINSFTRKVRGAEQSL